METVCQKKIHCTAYLLAFRFCNIFCINYFLFKTLIVFLRHVSHLHASVLYFFTTLALESVTFRSAGLFLPRSLKVHFAHKHAGVPLELLRLQEEFPESLHSWFRGAVFGILAIGAGLSRKEQTPASQKVLSVFSSVLPPLCLGLLPCSTGSVWSRAWHQGSPSNARCSKVPALDTAGLRLGNMSKDSLMQRHKKFCAERGTTG